MSSSFSFVTRVLSLLIPALIGVPATSAAELLPSDITATGSYLFDELGSTVTPDVTQAGTIFSTTSGVIGSTVTFDGDSVIGGSNPAASGLTHHGGGIIGAGDGFGGMTTVNANSMGGPTVFRSDTDLDSSNPNAAPLVITNNSTSTVYQVFGSLTYDHGVDAAGFDAGARSDFDLDLNGTRIFNSEVISDTFTGNFQDGIPIFGFGGLVQDSGVFTFDFVLLAGQSATIELDHTLESPGFPGFSDGTVSASSSHFLSIDNVTAVPEPTISVLMFVTVVASVVRKRGEWRNKSAC